MTALAAILGRHTPDELAAIAYGGTWTGQHSYWMSEARREQIREFYRAILAEEWQP